MNLQVFDRSLKKLTWFTIVSLIELGEAIVESLGEDPAAFREYFDFDEPDLAASLNHNFSMDVFDENAKEFVRRSYDAFDAKNVGAHIDGPPFIALLINDRPGLQVVAGEGQWIDAPVTCRTAEGDYHVPVIPGSVIVNTGGTLMHLSEGRYSATLHRVNTTLIPDGETRVSMPYFLLPKMEGDLVPFGKTQAAREGAAGIRPDAIVARTPALIAWVRSRRSQGVGGPRSSRRSSNSSAKKWRPKPRPLSGLLKSEPSASNKIGRLNDLSAWDRGKSGSCAVDRPCSPVVFAPNNIPREWRL